MIPIKTEQEIEKMRQGGKILAGIMEQLKKEVKPGKDVREIDKLAESLFFKYGRPSFKGYNDFPASICVSLNQEVVHAVPSKRIIKSGDLVSLDAGLFYQGFHTDMAVTLTAGLNEKFSDLIDTAEQAFWKAFKEIKEGMFFGDLSSIIEEYVEQRGFTVLRNLCGHGIGRELHEEPRIANFKEEGTMQIKKGMVFCLEPIIGDGEWEIEKKDFAYVTKDNSFSTHYEHTVALTSKGPEVLTAF